MCGFKGFVGVWTVHTVFLKKVHGAYVCVSLCDLDKSEIHTSTAGEDGHPKFVWSCVLPVRRVLSVLIHSSWGIFVLFSFTVDQIGWQ